MQTCIVHTREPLRFVRELGAARATVAGLLIFGAVASALVWPIFAFSTFWRAFGPGPAELSRVREGADVLISYLDEEEDAAETRRLIEEAGRKAVLVPGNIGGGPDRPSTYCAVIVKTVDERTRSKTSINELLRD